MLPLLYLSLLLKSLNDLKAVPQKTTMTSLESAAQESEMVPDAVPSTSLSQIRFAGEDADPSHDRFESHEEDNEIGGSL